MIRGSKRQRPNGRWQFTAELGKHPDGSRAQAHATIGGTSRYEKLTEREAERELQKWLDKLGSGGITAPDRVTVAEYLDRWLDEQKTLRSINTHRCSEQIVRVWAKPHIGNLRMQELRPEHTQAMFNEMRTHGLSPSTIKLNRAHLSAAMNRAVKTGIIATNPVAPTAIAKPRKAQHTIWTLDNIKTFTQFVATLDADRIYGQAALLAAQIGPRRAEIVALRRDDYKAGVLSIRRGATEVDGKIVFHDTKSELGVRDILLPQPARDLVREVLDQQKFHRGQKGYKDQGILFAGPRGQPLMLSSLGWHFRKLIKEAGLPAITFHELRTSAATFMIDLGIDPTVAADILGHDPRILLQIYRQVKGPQKEAAAEKMAAALAI